MYFFMAMAHFFKALKISETINHLEFQSLEY